MGKSQSSGSPYGRLRPLLKSNVSLSWWSEGLVSLKKFSKKKGRILVPRCFLCNEIGKTNNHLFLHCKFTAQLWHLFFSGQCLSTQLTR
ncbi:hypothetical protein MTR67_026760 [Solanum verrucosum]|uniref:Reverse transcriptase zinc-binding domain-containing protein n=1 Tax=Solanum verrucosum TaxID=315347 RepID=A0AAF0R664_SOLVR|nr:hypothetical protein MTR67_026760 [Solanum verrucosum]